MFEKTQGILGVKKKEESSTVMKDLGLEEKEGQGIITNLDFRGERILLPKLITDMTLFSDRGEYMIKAKKGKLEIEEFKI